MRLTKVYLCGKMSSLPKFNYPTFHKKAKELRLAGYDVFNPAEIKSDDSFQWEDYMREAIKMLLNCDLIYVLNGYETSKGANIEIDLAKTLNIHVVTENGDVLNEGRIVKDVRYIQNNYI